MTREERHLWYDFLRQYPIRFVRQKVLGQYIVDFYCAEAGIAIELDGSQHYEEENRQKDAQRSQELEAFHVQVLRIPNNEIHQHFAAVCEVIDAQVKEAIRSKKK